MAVTHVTRGNVLEDLGFTPEEAAVERMRIELAGIIEDYIKRRKMTQAEAGTHFGVPRPLINRILKRKFDEITLDRLVRLAAKTGKEVRITTRPAPMERRAAA